MEHISSWSMLMMLVCWMENKHIALLQARRKVCLEVNSDKTKYMVVSHHQTV
jgi:hypothetical protein